MEFASRSLYFTLRRFGLTVLAASASLAVIAAPTAHSAIAQPPNSNTGQPAGQSSVGQPSIGQPLTLRSDVQEANSVTGVITARGNVQINYPARQIQATSVQAQYYTKERRIVLSGNVYVLQNGNSMRGETITYLIDDGRFVATPDTGQQVESIYIVQDSPSPTPTPGQPRSQPASPAPARP